MLSPARTIWDTVWIDKDLAAAAVFLGDLCKALKIVVPVVIENDKLIILLKLSDKPVKISYLLACRGDKGILGICSTHIFFKPGRIADYLVETVFRLTAQPVAESILIIPLGNSGIGKGIAQRNTTLVEQFDSISDLLTTCITAQCTAAIPKCRRKASKA